MADNDHQTKPVEQVDTGRREFIRKASYTAPAIVTLGRPRIPGKALAQTLPSAPPPPFSPNSADEQLLEDIEQVEKQRGVKRFIRGSQGNPCRTHDFHKGAVRKGST